MGYFIDTVTSVDVPEIVKVGGKVIEIYEGVFYRKNIEISPFREVIDNLFALRQKSKDEKNDAKQILVKLSINSLNAEQIRRVCEKFLPVDPIIGCFPKMTNE